MSNIGIIDDNKDQRETLRLALEAHLENYGSSLGVIDIFPFKTNDIENYFKWINSNEVVCLIFDERMHNESENGKGPVGYRGNELVTTIRNRFKDIPIYVITSHKGDEDLLDKFSDFEDIIARQEFIDEGEKYVNRFIRASQRYLEEYTSELEALQKLSQKVAAGNSTEVDLVNLRALQTKLHIPIETGLGERKDWLDEYEQRIISLEELKTLIESQLNK